jgi:hypothetical protein
MTFFLGVISVTFFTWLYTGEGIRTAGGREGPPRGDGYTFNALYYAL